MTYSNSEARLRTQPKPQPPSEALREDDRELKPTRAQRAPGHTRRKWSRASLATALTLSLCALSGASAQTPYAINLNAPTIDKWVYPFASNGGATKTPASTFGAIGSAGFDDRDAQFYNAFDTSAIVPAGLGSEHYQILSATFTLIIAREEGTPGFLFDGTYDPISSYSSTGASIDDDPGRPIELYGAAYRNGFTSSTVVETTPFSTTPGFAESIRTIYASDFHLGVNRDVSNNITTAFDPAPFAIGQIAPNDLNADGTAKDDARVVFTLNLANPDVLHFLQLSLDQGRVGLVTSSLHPAAQGGPSVYPTYYSKENLVGSIPAQFDMEVQVVPEPSGITMALCGFGVFVACWRGRRVVANREERL